MPNELDMPAKSGVSHAVAAFVALLISPYLKAFALLVVDEQDVITAVQMAAQQAAERPEIPFSADVASLGLYLVGSFCLVFLWGYAYHYKRHA